MHAEHKCRKLRVGTIEYLPGLSKLVLRWHFWRKVAHREQGRFGNTAHLQSTTKCLQITSCDVSLAFAIDYLKTSNLDYLLPKKQHYSLSENFINSSSERKEKLKALRKQEKLKAKWKKHITYFGKSRMISMSEIECVKESFIIK